MNGTYTFISIAILIETICLTIYSSPHDIFPVCSGIVVIVSIIIFCSDTIIIPNTTLQFAVFFKLISDLPHFSRSSLSRHCSGAEIIPLVIEQFPTTSKLTKLRVAINAGITIKEYACILCLTNINTTLTEVIIVSINLMDSGKLFAVLVVSEATVLNSPAILNYICESVAILEGSVGVLEVSTGLTGKIGVNEGLKTVNLLILGLVCEGVKSICSEVCSVAKCTGVNNVKSVLCSECAFLGSKLNSCYHAKRICGCGIDSSGLVDPVKLKCQGIGFFIKSNRGK